MIVPQDHDAERSFLVTLCAPGAEEDAFLYLPLVDESDFLDPAHQALYRALSRLVESRSEINAITLKNTMEASGDLQRVGDFTGLLNILGAMEVGRPQFLAEIIKKKAWARRLMNIGHALEKEAAKTDNPMDLASRVQDSLQKLASGSKTHRRKATGIIDRMVAGEIFGPQDGGTSLIHFGVTDLDTHIEGAAGHIVVLGARPKCGKSALLVQAACESAAKGIKTLIISLEMDEDEVESRIASHIVKRDHLDFRRGFYKADDLHAVSKEEKLLDHIQTWVSSSGTPMSTIEAEIRDSVRRDGTKLVCVDYLQLVACPVGKGETMAQALGKVSQGFKRLAQELRICILLLAQINRDGGKGVEPTKEDLKGSGDIEQDANAIVMLWKNTKDERLLKIEANRSGPDGYRQTTEFDGSTSTFRQGQRLLKHTSVPQLGKAEAILQKKSTFDLFAD